MLNRSMLDIEKTAMLKGIIAGIVAGGILCGLIFGISMTNAVLGGFIGGCLGGLSKLYTRLIKFEGESDYYENSAKLQLKEEQLDISKKMIQTGEVSMHKEVLTEERNITVPVLREELVIKKKIVDEDTDSIMDEHTETIRIPIRTERVEVIKHPVILENVEVYKRKFQEIHHIEANLKKEKLNVEKSQDRS